MAFFMRMAYSQAEISHAPPLAGKGRKPFEPDWCGVYLSRPLIGTYLF